MSLDHGLSGRMERRLPIIVVVRLTECPPAVPMAKRRHTPITSVRAGLAYSLNMVGNLATNCGLLR